MCSHYQALGALEGSGDRGCHNSFAMLTINADEPELFRHMHRPDPKRPTEPVPPKAPKRGAAARLDGETGQGEMVGPQGLYSVRSGSRHKFLQRLRTALGSIEWRHDPYV
jgi:hypothetical protein